MADETRTLTAYQAFFQETFAKHKTVSVKKLNGKKWEAVHTQEIVKKVGAEWRALSDAQKKKYAGKVTAPVKAKGTKRKASTANNADDAEADDAEPIERPLSAYQCFFKEKFAELKVDAVKKLRGAKWASKDTQEIVKKLGKQWGSMSDAQKKKFAGKLTTTIKPKGGKRRRAAKGSSGRKLTAYNVFVRENSQGKGAGAAERMKSIGQQWKKMSDSAKAKYQQKADGLNAKSREI